MRSPKKILLSISGALCFYAAFGFVVPHIPNSQLGMSAAGWYAQCGSKQSDKEGYLLEFIDRTNVSFALWIYPPFAHFLRLACDISLIVKRG